MRRVFLCTGFVWIFAASMVADSNLRIADVGLHGYYTTGSASPIRLIVRNPSSQTRSVHLKIDAADQIEVTNTGTNDITLGGKVRNTVTTDITLGGDEQRVLELPIEIPGGGSVITADAITADAVFAHDTHQASQRQFHLVVLMCADNDVCKTAQSQIQFSGTVEERADKNRQITFEAVNDPRDHWWAYTVSSAVVLAMPMARLTSAQRDALEGFLRSGGEMVLLESEIADPSFLPDYRHSPASSKGERVGAGTLFRVSGLNANTLGAVFAGPSLQPVLQQEITFGGDTGWLRRRFATSFRFPRLLWVLIWLAAYTLFIGVLNFALLRRLRRLELGWISMGTLSLLFAVGFYFFSARERPRSFALDNLGTYYLDSQSPVALADYDLRLSASERGNVVVSVADPAVFVGSNLGGGTFDSQIWAEMNRENEQREYELRIGPPTQADLSMLKWSFRDLNLQGLHKFPGSLHLVAPNRLRNDTGQQFNESVYLDYTKNVLTNVSAMAPGAEIQLDALTPTPMPKIDQRNWRQMAMDSDDKNRTLQEVALRGGLPLAREGRVFAGLSDGPVLPVGLSVPHQQSIHSLIVVYLGKP